EVAAEYGKLAGDAVAALDEPVGTRKRTLARLRREFRRIRRRDYFSASEREGARAALDELAASVQEVVA
ncbi:MAG: chromate resistance protein, partial [Chloroflexota bacterium]|nr:chromate resistance protein [Chloroflexota bacterium]